MNDEKMDDEKIIDEKRNDEKLNDENAFNSPIKVLVTHQKHHLIFEKEKKYYYPITWQESNP